MYSEHSIEITQSEFNYLLPPLRAKLHQSNNKYFFCSNNLEDTEDMLNRLKGLYDNYDELKSMVAYYCSKNRTLKPFRDSINISINKVNL